MYIVLFCVTITRLRIFKTWEITTGYIVKNSKTLFVTKTPYFLDFF